MLSEKKKKSFMIQATVLYNVKFPPRFINKELKINVGYITNMKHWLLIFYLLLTDCISKRIGCFNKILHYPKIIQAQLHANCQTFIKQEDCLSSSRDFIPLNYCICRILECKLTLRFTDAWILSKLPYYLNGTNYLLK